VNDATEALSLSPLHKLVQWGKEGQSLDDAT
jgi:hypothetical protein